MTEQTFTNTLTLLNGLKPQPAKLMGNEDVTKWMWREEENKFGATVYIQTRSVVVIITAPVMGGGMVENKKFTGNGQFKAALNLLQRYLNEHRAD